MHLVIKILMYSFFYWKGGAAGAVSRITGTLGKGLAALTLDDEYQKKRREAMNKRPANVGEGFARGGKGLVMVRYRYMRYKYCPKLSDHHLRIYTSIFGGNVEQSCQLSTGRINNAVTCRLMILRPLQ